MLFYSHIRHISLLLFCTVSFSAQWMFFTGETRRMTIENHALIQELCSAVEVYGLVENYVNITN